MVNLFFVRAGEGKMAGQARLSLVADVAFAPRLYHGGIRHGGDPCYFYSYPVFFFGLHALRLTFMNQAAREVGRLCAGAAFLGNDISNRCLTEEGLGRLILSRLPPLIFSENNMTVISRNYATLAEAAAHTPCVNDEGGELVVAGDGLYATFEVVYETGSDALLSIPLSARPLRLPGRLCTAVLVYREGLPPIGGDDEEIGGS